jgi:hypothetical protein
MIRVESWLVTRTAVAADLPALQQVYRAASLSNSGDALRMVLDRNRD